MDFFSFTFSIQYTVHGHDMRHESTQQYTDMRMHAFFQAMLNGDIYTQIALNNKWSFNWSLPQLGKQMPFPLNFQQKTGYLLLKSTMSIFLLKITVNDNFGFKPLLLKRCATLFCGNFLFVLTIKCGFAVWDTSVLCSWGN